MTQTNDDEDITGGLMICTLTGVDDRTNLDQVVSMSKLHNFVEWGFLYSPSAASSGMKNRYPTVENLRKAFTELPAEVNVALHLCGAAVPQLLDKSCAIVAELVDLVEARHGVVQLNFSAKRLSSIAKLHTLFTERPELEFITQYNSANKAVAKEFPYPNHSVLFDASGGRGQVAEGYAPPLRGVLCGYAGGLGPANVFDQLNLIEKVAGEKPYWIDMENSLRVLDAEGGDWLSLDACKVVLEECDRWKTLSINRKLAPPATLGGSGGHSPTF